MEDKFTTSDFYTAAFLKAAGLKLIGINKADPRRFHFVFKDQEERAKLLEDFFVGDAKVEVRNFIASIKELKSLMYSDAISRQGDVEY